MGAVAERFVLGVAAAAEEDGRALDRLLATVAVHPPRACVDLDLVLGPFSIDVIFTAWLLSLSSTAMSSSSDRGATKPATACVESQYGLLPERPQRQRAIRRCSTTILTGPPDEVASFCLDEEAAVRIGRDRIPRLRVPPLPGALPGHAAGVPAHQAMSGHEDSDLSEERRVLLGRRRLGLHQKRRDVHAAVDNGSFETRPALVRAPGRSEYGVAVLDEREPTHV